MMKYKEMQKCKEKVNRTKTLHQTYSMKITSWAEKTF